MRDYVEQEKVLRANAMLLRFPGNHNDLAEMIDDAADAIKEFVAMRNVLKSRLAQLEKAEYESGDCVETYKNGFFIGKRQGAIELLREILGIDVDDPPKEVE